MYQTKSTNFERKVRTSHFLKLSLENPRRQEIKTAKVYYPNQARVSTNILNNWGWRSHLIVFINHPQRATSIGHAHINSLTRPGGTFIKALGTYFIRCKITGDILRNLLNKCSKSTRDSSQVSPVVPPGLFTTIYRGFQNINL